MVGLAVAAAVCAGAFFLFGTAGLGAILAVVVSPWLLIPTALLLVGLVAWYGNRRHRITRDVVDNAGANQESVGA
jgi:hypothetical protein